MTLKLTYVELVKAHEVLRELETKTNAQKAVVDALKSKLMQEMDEVGTTVVSADLGSVSIVETSVPTVRDWEAFYAHIMETGSWDLLQRRVSSTAWRSRLEAAQQVPGVETFIQRSLRVR